MPAGFEEFIARCTIGHIPGRTILLVWMLFYNLKSAVAREDPAAFVVVSAAREILGRGFNPLSESD